MSKRRKVFVPKLIEDDGLEFMTAFIPSQIEAQDNYDPRLIGFPLNILFAAMKQPQSGQQSLVECLLRACAGNIPRELNAKGNAVFHETEERPLDPPHLR